MDFVIAIAYSRRMLYRLASKKGHSSRQFSACLLWPNSWMDISKI